MIIHERLTKTHLYFLRGVFSNFQHCPSLVIDDIKFSNTEVAFMFFKAKHFNDLESMEKIKNESNPYRAKQLGRLVKNYNDKEWDKVRYGYMYKVNLAKYVQNSYFFDILINTKDLVLVEANGRPDNIWSCGLYVDNDKILNEKNWTGKNLLGKVLMEIREYFYKMKG